MNVMKSFFLLSAVLVVLLSNSASAGIVERLVDYQDGEVVLEGFLAYDDAIQDARPGILVVHDWDGLNDYERSRAVALAELGYTAFAADIYGKNNRPATMEENAEFAGIYKNDPDLFRQRLMAGLGELRGQPTVLADRIAAIGYCFGGAGVLELARSGADILAAIPFHGILDTEKPAGKGDIRCRILVMHGDADPYVPAKQMAAFKKEMDTSGADWQMIVFGDAVHAFTVPGAGDDPSTGAAYDATADTLSWNYLLVYLQELFAS